MRFRRFKQASCRLFGHEFTHSRVFLRLGLLYFRCAHCGGFSQVMRPVDRYRWWAR